MAVFPSCTVGKLVAGAFGAAATSATCRSATHQCHYNGAYSMGPAGPSDAAVD